MNALGTQISLYLENIISAQSAVSACKKSSNSIFSAMNIYDPKLHEIWPEAKERQGRKMVLPIPAHLEAFIEGYFEINHQEQAGRISMILPDLSPHIIAYKCEGEDEYRLSLVGPRSSAIIVNRRPRLHTLIIRFKPSALSFFTSENIQALKDKSFPLEEVLCSITGGHPLSNGQVILGGLGRSIRKEAFGKNSPHQLARAFLGLVKAEKGPFKVKEAAKRLGCSDRYLRKALSETTGMGPLFAIRLERLKHSLILRQVHTHYNWSDIAHLSGYYDHAHMVEEYQALLHRAPTQLFRFFQGG